VGQITVAGGTVMTRDVAVGSFSPGTLTVAAGAMSLSSNLLAGAASGWTGSVWVTGGQLIATNATTEIGRFGFGRLTVSNGTLQARDLVLGRFSGSQGTATLAGGTLTVDGLFLTNTASRFVFNSGTLNARGASVTNGQPFVVGNGTLSATYILQGGIHAFANTLRIAANASLTGTGTISATVTNAGSIAPGLSAGRLNVNGNLVLQPTSTLRFELGGYIQGTDYDHLNVAGSVSVTGTLALSIINNFITTMTNGASFTVLTANSISGSFANATNGSRLVTSDGFGNFLVSYGGTALVLGDFKAVDTDGDGLPDWWEQTYFGSVTGATAGADSDGDGLSNLQEFLAGTVPTDSSSALRIVAILTSGPDILIRFSSASGKRYLVEYKNGLSDTSWSTLMDNIPGNGSILQIIDPGAASLPRRFYRISLIQ
jgi:hypothetical protein